VKACFSLVNRVIITSVDQADRLERNKRSFKGTVILKHIRALIFDLDGTLVTSTLDFVQIRRELGCSAEDDVLEFVEQLGGREREEAHEIIHRHEVRDAEASEWLPGAQAFIHECHAHQIPLAIVTRNSDFSSRLKIARNQIPISHLVTRENSRPKPDPSALQEIARSFSMEPGEMMMVGDYRYDLEAGRNAKMQTCLINFESLPDYAHLADYRFSDFDRFHQAFFSAR